MKKNTRKLIYVLRSQCDKCNLDKMISFYRVPNATPTAMFEGHEKLNKQEWPKRYKCKHKITFTRELDKNYVWDLTQNKAVKR